MTGSDTVGVETREDGGPIIGIDFGTSGMRVAAFVDGRPVMIEGRDGASTMPADVLVRADGSVLVGSAAVRLGPGKDAALVHAAKRLLGRSWEDPAMSDARGELGENLQRGDDGLPIVRIGEFEMTPADVCAHMFRHIRVRSSQKLGIPVEQAVLAVPADFGFIQREALADIAAQAGLNVVRIVSEPTAAALYSGQGADNRKIAVYDFGGGTFDISILDVGDEVYQVLASDGDPFLGGEDIDQRLLSHVLQVASIDREELDPRSMFALRTAVERLKRELSAEQTAEIDLPHLRTRAGCTISLRQTISREVLQDLCQDLVDRTLVICRRALQAVEEGETRRALEPADVDVVVLVGGTTWLPFVEDAVTRFFGRIPEAASRREDAVALGCAIYGGILSGQATDRLLLDARSRSYAIQVNQDDPVTLLPRHGFTVSMKQLSVEVENISRGDVRIRILEIGTGVATIVTEVEFSPQVDGHERAKLDLTLSMDTGGRLTLRIFDRIAGVHRDQEIHVRPRAADGIATTTRAKPDFAGLQATDVPTSAAGPPPRRRILAVATEWSSGAGGLSTFNRDFCLALSTAGHDVRCLVLGATAQERQAAQAAGVKLIEAAQTSGMTQQTALARKPAMDDDWRPEIVIGHGRVTGPAAESIASDDYPEAKRLHVIHMAPEDIEWFKLDRGNDAGDRANDRTTIERRLGESADYVAAVGPKLHNRFLTEFVGTDRRPMRLDPGFDSSGVTPIAPPPGDPWRILLVGRAEDETLKGLDIAGAALGRLFRDWSGTRFELRVRGTPEGEGEALRRKIIEWSGVPGLRVVTQPYSASAEDLKGDYRRSSLVIMPSRSEGFGLVGLEAICAGVPMLASAESGLADLIVQELPPEEAGRIVVPITHELERDADAWAWAIGRILMDRDAAFANASRVRSVLAGTVTWRRAVERLFEEMEPLQ